MERNVDDTIADYLSGALNTEARLEFEKQIASHPELAARVALEQSLVEALGKHTPENQLRANLERIAQQFESPEALEPAHAPLQKKPSFRWFLPSMGLIIALVALIWVFTKQDSPLPPTPPAPGLMPTPPKSEEQAPKPTPPKQAENKPSPPIAAAYKPIQALERYIGSQTRSGALQVRVDKPLVGSSIPWRAGGSQVQISGQITGDNLNEVRLNYLIFSNNTAQFESMRPLLSQALEMDKNGRFNFQKRLNAPPGLYYLLLENPDSGEWLWVGKMLLAE